MWRLITKDSYRGEMRFGSLKSIPDGTYVFTLQKDYGRRCAAVTRPFTMRAGLVESISVEASLIPHV